MHLAARRNGVPLCVATSVRLGENVIRIDVWALPVIALIIRHLIHLAQPPDGPHDVLISPCSGIWTEIACVSHHRWGSGVVVEKQGGGQESMPEVQSHTAGRAAGRKKTLIRVELPPRSGRHPSDGQRPAAVAMGGAHGDMTDRHSVSSEQRSIRKGSMCRSPSAEPVRRVRP